MNNILFYYNTVLNNCTVKKVIGVLSRKPTNVRSDSIYQGDKEPNKSHYTCLSFPICHIYLSYIIQVFI